MISVDTLYAAAEAARRATSPLDGSVTVEIVLTEDGFVVRGRTDAHRASKIATFSEVAQSHYPLLPHLVRLVVEQIATTPHQHGAGNGEKA